MQPRAKSRVFEPFHIPYHPLPVTFHLFLPALQAGEVYLAEDTIELKRKVGINAHDLHRASSSPLFDQRQIPRAEFYRL